MNTELRHINVNGIDYPIIYSVNVMSEIQKKYGSIDHWSELIEPKKKGIEAESDIDALLFFYKEAINEGIDIENEKNNEDRKFITLKQAGRIVNSMGTQEAGNELKETVITASPKTVQNEGESSKNE